MQSKLSKIQKFGLVEDIRYTLLKRDSYRKIEDKCTVNPVV